MLLLAPLYTVIGGSVSGDVCFVSNWVATMVSPDAIVVAHVAGLLFVDVPLTFGCFVFEVWAVDWFMFGDALVDSRGFVIDALFGARVISRTDRHAPSSTWRC